MDNPEDKEAYEEVIATINQSKKDGDLVSLKPLLKILKNFLNRQSVKVLILRKTG